MAAKLLALALLLAPAALASPSQEEVAVDQVSPLLKQSAFDYLDEKHAFKAAKITSAFKSVSLASLLPF